MHSRDALPAIRSIKDSVEQSSWRNWIGSTSKRHRTERYLDGALRVMNILGDDASSKEQRQFDRLYDRVTSLPPSWPDERLSNAEDLWKFVMNVADRIYPYLSPPAKSKEYHDFFYPSTPPRSPARRRSVRFEETPQVYTRTASDNSSAYSPIQCIYPAAAAINTGWWWPSSWPSAWYAGPQVW